MAEGKWWFFPFQDFLIGIPWDSTVGAIDVTQGLCRTLAMAWFGESQELCCSWVACSCYNWMGIITAMMINTRMCLYIYMCVKYKHTHTYTHTHTRTYVYICVCVHTTFVQMILASHHWIMIVHDPKPERWRDWEEIYEVAQEASWMLHSCKEMKRTHFPFGCVWFANYTCGILWEDSSDNG